MSGRHPDHRVRLPVTLQSWCTLTFLHWRVERAAVQRLLPRGVVAQEIDGSAWVALTPFRMTDVRVPGVPPVPGWSTFPELNVRTYVRGPDGRDGLWFLRLVAPRRAVVVGLRSIGLPYVVARGRLRETVDPPVWRYRFDRPGAPGWFDATVGVGEPVTDGARAGTLDALTGRWAAYHRRAGVLWRTPVEHEPWPLLHATADGDLTRPLVDVGLEPPSEAPMVHASPGVDVRIGPLRPVGPMSSRRGHGLSHHAPAVRRGDRPPEDPMSFQAYLDTIEDRTGLTPRQLLGIAREKGLDRPPAKANDVVAWLAEDYGLGRGHAMALWHVISKGPTIGTKHVGTDGVHRDASDTLWLDGRATRPAT